jgi:hypothetical protein
VAVPVDRPACSGADKIAGGRRRVDGRWAVGIIGLLRMFLFGSDAVRRRDIYLVRTLGLAAGVLVMIAIAGFSRLRRSC